MILIWSEFTRARFQIKWIGALVFLEPGIICWPSLYSNHKKILQIPVSKFFAFFQKFYHNTACDKFINSWVLLPLNLNWFLRLNLFSVFVLFIINLILLCFNSMIKLLSSQRFFFICSTRIHLEPYQISKIDYFAKNI